MGCEDVRTQENAAARKRSERDVVKPCSAPARFDALDRTSKSIESVNMDVDDFDDCSTYSLSLAEESSLSDEEQESIELPGAELRIEGDFKYAMSFPYSPPLF